MQITRSVDAKGCGCVIVQLLPSGIYFCIKGDGQGFYRKWVESEFRSEAETFWFNKEMMSSLAESKQIFGIVTIW